MFSRRAEYIAKTMSSKLWTRILDDETLPYSSVREISFRNLLKEADKIQKMFGEVSEQHKIVREKVIMLILEHLNKADPTKNSQYLQWIAARWIGRDFRAEDVRRIRDELENFEKFKPRLRRDKHPTDINQYKSAGDVFVLLKQYIDEDVAHSAKEEQRRKEKAFFDNKEAEIAFEDDTMKIVIPHTPEASSHFGRGTRWCTTSAYSTNMFHHYNKSGPLFIIMTATGKYQFHFESHQFMNELDQHIQISTLARKFPLLKKVFSKQADKFLIFPLMETISQDAWERAFEKLYTTKGRYVQVAGYSNPGDLIKDMPKEYQTLKIALYVLDISIKMALAHIRPDLQAHPSFQTKVLLKRPELLQALPPENQTQEMIEEVVAQSPMMLRYVREDLMSSKVITAALRKNPIVLGQIPQKKQTLEIIGVALKATKNRATQRSLINMVHDFSLRRQLHETLKQIC